MFDSSVSEENSISIFLSRAINEFGITSTDLESVMQKDGKYYVLLSGEKSLSIINKSASYKLELLNNVHPISSSKSVIFENSYMTELGEYENHMKNVQDVHIKNQYYNDRIEKSINNIIDYVTKQELALIFDEASSFISCLIESKEKCGYSTEGIITMINRSLKKTEIDNDVFLEWIGSIESSCVIRDIEVEGNACEFAIALWNDHN